MFSIVYITDRRINIFIKIFLKVQLLSVSSEDNAVKMT